MLLSFLGRAKWNLIYRQAAYPIEAPIIIPEIDLEMGWLPYMPSADVRKIEGKRKIEKKRKKEENKEEAERKK